MKNYTKRINTFLLSSVLFSYCAFDVVFAGDAYQAPTQEQEVLEPIPIEPSQSGCTDKIENAEALLPPNPFEQKLNDKKIYGKYDYPSTNQDNMYEICQKLSDHGWLKIQEILLSTGRLANETLEDEFEGAWQVFFEKGRPAGLDLEIGSSTNGSDRKGVITAQDLEGKTCEEATIILENKIKFALALNDAIKMCAGVAIATSYRNYHQIGSDLGGTNGNGKDSCASAGYETQDYPACEQALTLSARAAVMNGAGQIGGGVVASRSVASSGYETDHAQIVQNAAQHSRNASQGSMLAAAGQGSAAVTNVVAARELKPTSFYLNQCASGLPLNFGNRLTNIYLNNYIAPIAQKLNIKLQVTTLNHELSYLGQPVFEEGITEEKIEQARLEQEQCRDQAHKANVAALDKKGDKEKAEMGNEGVEEVSQSNGALAYKDCFSLAEKLYQTQDISSNNPYCSIASNPQWKYITLAPNTRVRQKIHKQSVGDGLAGILSLLQGFLQNWQKDKFEDGAKDIRTAEADPRLAPKLGDFLPSKGALGPKLEADPCLDDPTLPGCEVPVAEDARANQAGLGGFKVSSVNGARPDGLFNGKDDDSSNLNPNRIDDTLTPSDLGGLEQNNNPSNEFIDAPPAAVGMQNRGTQAAGGGGGAGLGGAGLPGAPSGGARGARGGSGGPKPKTSETNVKYKSGGGGGYKTASSSRGPKKKDPRDPFGRFRNGINKKGGKKLKFRGPASDISSKNLWSSITEAYKKASSKGKLLQYVYKEGESQLKDPKLGL